MGGRGNWLVTMLSFAWENISQVPINYQDSKSIQGQFCWNNIGKFIAVVRSELGRAKPPDIRRKLISVSALAAEITFCLLYWLTSLSRCRHPKLSFVFKHKQSIKHSPLLRNYDGLIAAFRRDHEKHIKAFIEFLFIRYSADGGRLSIDAKT